MKFKKIYALLLTVALSLTTVFWPSSVWAIGDITMEDDVSNPDLLELSEYDTVTQTTTTYTVSLNALRAQNEATKERLGLSGQNVMLGYQPPSDLEIMESELIGGELGGGSVASPNIIIGEDDQKEDEYVDTTEHPYDCVLLLQLLFDLDDDGTYDIQCLGTGFLVGRNMMLTSAHNFYTKFYQDDINKYMPGSGVEPGYFWVDQCRIYPGHSASDISNVYDDYYFPRTWTWPSQYIQESSSGAITVNENYDWLLATLFSPLGESRGWFGLTQPSNSELIGMDIELSGYPAVTDYKRHYQFSTTGNISDYGTRRVYYDNDTEGGNSGSPVFIYLPVEISGFPSIYVPHVVAIHQGWYDSTCNKGVRISDHLYDLVQERILEDQENYG